jgi:hypothetical protein
MSLITRIPPGSALAVVGGIFQSAFGNPTVGEYDFTNYKVGGTRFNVAIPLGLKFNPSYLYFFHQLNFSMSIDEGTFLSAIKQGTAPTLTIRDSTSRRSIFHNPFRLFRYFENLAVDSFHLNSNANAELLADFQAELVQVADLVGITQIFAQVSFSIYEIKDLKFIDDYKKEVQ